MLDNDNHVIWEAKLVLATGLHLSQFRHDHPLGEAVECAELFICGEAQEEASVSDVAILGALRRKCLPWWSNKQQVELLPVDWYSGIRSLLLMILHSSCFLMRMRPLSQSALKSKPLRLPSPLPESHTGSQDLPTTEYSAAMDPALARARADLVTYLAAVSLFDLPGTLCRVPPPLGSRSPARSWCSSNVSLTSQTPHATVMRLRTVFVCLPQPVAACLRTRQTPPQCPQSRLPHFRRIMRAGSASASTPLESSPAWYALGRSPPAPTAGSRRTSLCIHKFRRCAVWSIFGCLVLSPDPPRLVPSSRQADTQALSCTCP